jgi:DNA-cytosine methyltransferase
MKILSLFDGMSCGQQALERAGFKVDNYFASEIDKYAIQVTMANYPNTIQLGSVVNVDGYSLPKIDLLIGGSPCQSFSFAGKRKGMATKCETEILTLEHYLELKEQGFEFEGQSYLFWEFMRLLNECKPTYFLLENVEMGEKWEKVLSKAIGVNGIHINSSLVSAQNRKRIYWTNIGLESAGLFGDLESIIQQPKDKGILLKDILESAVDEKYFLSEKTIATITRHGNKIIDDKQNPKQSCTIHANYFKMGGRDQQYVFDKDFKGLDINEKSRTIRTGGKDSADDKHNWNLIVHNTMPRSSTTGKGGTGPLSRADGKTYCLDTGNTNAVEIVGLTEVRTEEAKQIRKETGTNPKRAKELIERTDGKTGALLTSQTPDNLVKIVLTSKDKRLQKIVDNNIFIDGEIAHLDTYNQTIDKNKSPALKLPHGDRFIIAPTESTNDVEIRSGDFDFDGNFRERQNGKSGTLRARAREDESCSQLASINSRIRRLTPLECERLQTVADNYTNHVSDSQRYKMLGNGWTVDVIAHIFSYMK